MLFSNLINSSCSSKNVACSNIHKGLCLIQILYQQHCIGILGIRIRNNEEIDGINIDDKECKISYHADDTSLIKNGSASL